jgi:predicted O-methyltransferase YrrM
MGKSEIVENVSKNIHGRLANMIGERITKNIDILLDFVEKAGGGNHLEIGALHGGSAIAVALLKKELGHGGIVLTIDPLNGYYHKYAPREDAIDTQSGVPVTPGTLFHNINKFGVGDRVAVLQANSVPFPRLAEMKFSTAFIDGDHRDGVPLQDWKSVRDIVTKYVIFDNCADTHPDVVHACTVATQDNNWYCVYDKDIMFVVERVRK